MPVWQVRTIFIAMKNIRPVLVLTAILAGCATSSADLRKEFRVDDSAQAKFDGDFTKCEQEAYNAGYVRRGGLLNEGPRKEFLEQCLQKRGWARQ